MSEIAESLFARPTFAEGWGRIMDFGDSLSEYNRSATPEEADYLGALMDWGATGSFIHHSLIEQQLDNPQKALDL